MEEEPAEEAVGMEAVKEEPDSLKNFEIDDEMETLLEDLEDLVFEFNDPNIQGVDFDEDSEEECVVLDDENESGGEEEGGGEREVGENEEEEEGGEEEAIENEGGEEEREEQEDVEGEEEEENVEFGEGQKHVEFGEEEEQEDVEVEEDAEVEGEEGQEDVEFEEKEEQEDEEEEDEEEEDPEAEGKYGQGDVDVEQEDNRVDEESVKKGDEIVGGKNTVDNEYEDLSDGEIFSDEESKSLKVEKSEKEILVKNQMNGSSKDDQSLQSSKGGSVKKTRVRIVYKSEDVDKEADKKYSVINNSAKAKITCQPSKTCTKDEATSTIDNEILRQILPNEKTDQHSHNSTNSSIENTKPVRKSSTELSRVVDKCDEQEKLVCDKGSNVEARRSSVSTEEIFHSDFGVQTTFELSMLSKKEMEDECDIYCDLDKLPFKEFESGECTSSDDDEAVNALKLDKMFNHKIDNMMNNFTDSERQDSSSKPTSEQINNSKKKDQIIKLLYKKIKSVGEHKIVQEMLAKNLIDEDSKDKLLEIIRYCVEKRREKKRMKKLKKRAHLLRITKNNDYKEALKLKSEVVSTQEKLSKTRTLSPVVVHSKVTKRVIVDCNSANLKSEIVDNDLRRLIQKKQSLDKEVEASSLVDEKEFSRDSSSLVVKKVSSKVLSSCRKKGCYKVNCKKHRSKEEKKLRKAERKKRKIEILIKRRELLKRQYFEERRRNEAALLAAASKQENDLEMQKKIELQNRIKEKIALVLDRKYSKQAEVSRSETVTTNELKQDGKRRSREGSYSSDCSRKSSNKASTSHPIKTVVKGPAADSFSEMYEVLNKKPAKEVKSVSSEVKDNKRVQNDDEGELFPTITSIISKEIEMDTNPPSPPPPPIISAMEGGEKEEEEKKVVRRVEHVSRRDQHLRQMIGKILSDKVANLPSPPQAAVKPRLPVRRRSRSSVRNSEEVNRAIVKSRSRSPVKHWKPAASKPEAIVAPRRRSPSPGDRYNKRTAPRGRATILEPPLKTVRTREPSCALWKRRSRSRSRENRSALYSPTHSPRSTPYSPTRSPSRSPESPPRLSRLSEIRRQKKEDFEEAIRKWRETQEKKPEPPTAFHENGYPGTPMSGHEQTTYPSFNCMANQFVHDQTFLQYTHAQPPAHMMSPYHVNIPDTSRGQYGPPPVMLGGPSPATYQSQDLMQAAPQPPLNSSGQQVATISTADNGTTLGQSSGGITTITENEPQGLGKSTHCHHNATIADAQPTFNRPPEGFPYFNSQTNPGYPPIRPGMDTELKDGNSIMGFPMFPPSVPPPYKVVHHPKFPYPIPVPYIEPPCPAPPSVAPLIPFLGPPPNMSQPPPGHSLLNAQPPLPLTEPPPLINPPLPSSPAPSTVCSSPVRPSSPAISECGSVRSTTSRKKIGQDIKNVIDLIKGKLVKGEQPSQSESPTKTFNINDVRDIILSVRKSLAQKKSQAETQDKSRNELVSRSPAKNKSQTEPLDKSENGNLAQKKTQSVTPEKTENESSPQDKPKPEERKLRIEFKKPAVKSVLSQEVAPEFIKAMQEDEDEEEEEGELADPKPKLDKEAALQKKMKVLEILNGLNSKMSQDHKTPPGRNGDCDKGRLQTEKTCELNEFNVRKRSPKENGDRSLTVEKCHLYKSLPSSSGRKLQYESKTETRKISDESITVSRRVTDESEAVTGRISDESKTVSRRVSDESEAVTKRISDKSKTVSRRVSDESMTASGSISDESNTISGRSFDEPKKVERICDESKTVSGRVSDEPKKVETISDEPNKVSERISEESKTVPGRISDEPKKVERISDESKSVSTNMSDEYKTVSGRISDEPKKVETISNESKTVSGNISDKSRSSQSSENSELSLEDEVQGKTSIPEASPGHPSSKQPSPIAAELETSSLIDTEPDIVLESVPMDISPIKTQELNEIQSATSSKISPDKRSKEERKCIGQIVFSKSYKDSKAKTEDEKEASSKQKRRFSDTPNDSTKRSHQRSENDYKFSDVESVLQKSVPTEIRTDNLENLTVQEKSSTVDKSKLDQLIDSGKNESPVSKLSREEIQKQLNRALAHAKAACRASTVDVLKNSKSDNKQSPQEKPSSTKVSIQKKLTKDSTPVGTVEAKKNVSLDLKKEGNLSSPENTQFSSSKDSTRSDTASNIQEVRNESSTSNNISTTNPNTPHSDPRLKKVDNESTSKNTEIGQNRVLDPRLKRDPRVRHIEVNRDTDMPQTTKLDPRLNRNLHSETNKSLDPSRASVVDPRLNKTQDAEVGKHFETSQTLKTDPRLNRPHHAEAVENVDLLKNSSPSPKLSRANSFEVNRNSEILQRTQQNIETLETRNSHSEVSFKKTASKPNLKSLTLRVMNELDPVLLNFGGAEGNIDEDEELETYEIVNDSTRSSNEEYIKNTSITVSKSLPPGPSCVNKFSETVEQNLKLKSSDDGQKAVDPEIKSSITDYSEKSTIIPVKSDQDHAKQQSQLQLETSQNEAEINKTEEKMNDVVESNIEPEEIEASRTVIPAIKKRIAHDQTKVIERKLVKDYVSKSAAREIRDKDKKPVKYCSSSSKTTSNKEKGLESSTKKEQSLRKGEKSDSKTDKRSSSSSGSVLSEKSKSINVSKSESKHIPSNSKKTDGSTQKSAHINKGDPKFENRTASKSSTASKVDDLRKDKKSEKSTISSEELSKLMKNRRSSYESSTSNAQKNLSSDSSSKLRRVSLDLVMEKEKKKVVIESADIGTSKQSSSAKKSSSSLEKPLLKSSKSTEVVKSAGEVQSDEGRKKAEKYHDKASSSKFVVSNLANKEVTRMEPPKVHQRRSSVIELSSSDDECVRIISPGSKKRSEASSDSVKKTKYKRTDSVLQTCKIIKENLAQKKTSSSNSKGIGISQNKLISEVDILKRQLESDSSDDEIEFMRKKSKPVDSMLTSNAAKKDRGEKVIQSIPTKKVVVCESIREVADGKDKSNDVPVRNIDDNNKSIKKVEVKKVDAISESLNTKQAEKTVMFQKKTETAHEVDKSPVNVTNKIFSDVESQEKAKAIGAIEKPKSDVNTIESIGTSEENNPTKQIDEVGKSDESCACKKIVTEKTMTVEKIDDTKSTEKVKKLRLSKEGEPVKNAEEVKSSEAGVENIDKLGSESSLIGPNNKIGEKENLIDHKSLESSVIETCQASSKMKELTLSNEDFNFEVDASSDVKNAPNTGKTKKIDKTGKLKNKFLKIGDELFPDEESNESSGSFKNLITNICGTLEENSGSPAVLESAVKNIEDASLVVAESIKMLDTFVQVAQSVFRQRKRICVDYFEVTDDNQLIQHISDNKKSKFPKSKLGKGSRSNIIDKDSFDSNSLLSNDSYDVFEFSEDLPAAINDRRSLTSSSETIRSNKPRLENDNNKIEEKDSEPSTADNFIEPSSTVLQSPTETTVVESVRVNEISKSDVKDVSEKDESRIESSGENVIQEKVYEKHLKDIDQIEVIKKSKIISSKNEMNNFSVQTAEKSGNSTDVTNINENHDIPIQIGISSEKTVGTKSFDATLSQNDKKVESSGEEVAGKKGFNKFSAQEIEIIERPAGVVISVKREDEIQAQNINETSSSIDKKISTSCGTFQVNSESAFQSQRQPVIKSKTSKKLQARYKANLNAFKISTTDEKRKSSLVDDANKLSTSNDSTGNEEPSNEISLINSQETEVNPNHTLVSNNMIEKSSINKASSKSKTSKRASSVLEEVSDEVPKKKCKLKSKVKAETCDEVEENTDDTNIRVTRARKSGGNLVDSKLVDNESSSVFNDDSQEGEEFSTRVTRKRKIASSSCTVEEVNDLEGDDDKTEGRVTRASKSVGSSARSDEIVLQENDSQETDKSKTRVLRARKSLVVMADDSQDSEEFNTRVTRAKKSLVTSVKEVEDDVEEDVPRKKLRSSLKIPSKEGDILNTSQSDDERFWIKICSAFSKNSRTVGAQVAEVRGKLVGFESFESVEQPSEELDLDNAIASLIRLKQQRDSQKL